MSFVCDEEASWASCPASDEDDSLPASDESDFAWKRKIVLVLVPTKFEGDYWWWWSYLRGTTSGGGLI